MILLVGTSWLLLGVVGMWILRWAWLCCEGCELA